ncbi:MAG: galactokinase [Saprospiraceae bacterium]|nr:galactokinase [Saprospiraceae bacterium]
MKEDITASFIAQYKKTPDHCHFAPGRANIIGEHTDYNEGFVLPFALEKGIWFAGSVNNTSVICIKAKDTDEYTEIDLDTLQSQNDYSWAKYFIQVLLALPNKNIRGVEICFGGNLPIGAGISSSSAIACGFTYLLDKLNSLMLSPKELVDTAVLAEQNHGVKGGIMDQFCIFNGKKDKAILLDCRTDAAELLPLELKNHKFYLINTNVKHHLLDTDYNNRRKQCDLAVSYINQYIKPISALRDLQITDLIELQSKLDDDVFRIVSFVVQENNRVLLAKEALTNHNFTWLGTLMYESHDGLSQMYRVSCDELDWLVNYTFNHDHILGARMMGGGFGGCTINLVNGDLGENFQEKLKSLYFKEFGKLPDIFEISSADGILAMN